MPRAVTARGISKRPPCNLRGPCNRPHYREHQKKSPRGGPGASCCRKAGTLRRLRRCRPSAIANTRAERTAKARLRMGDHRRGEPLAVASFLPLFPDRKVAFHTIASNRTSGIVHLCHSFCHFLGGWEGTRLDCVYATSCLGHSSAPSGVASWHSRDPGGASAAGPSAPIIGQINENWVANKAPQLGPRYAREPAAQLRRL